tara:strand:+ start:6797 stop:7441 length:645 start_codon:yes stop_codon:yes gene_type:complete
MNQRSHAPTLQEIADTVAKEYRIPNEALMSKRQYPEIVWARRETMHRAQTTGYNNPEIADFFNLDVSTVFQGLKKYDNDLKSGKKERDQATIDRYEKVIALAKEGCKPRDIATKLGIHYKTLISILHRGRVRGDVQAFYPISGSMKDRNRTWRERINKSGTRLGRTTEMMNVFMSEEVREFFVNDTIEGKYSCVAECMADHLTDSYFKAKSEEH